MSAITGRPASGRKWNEMPAPDLDLSVLTGFLSRKGNADTLNFKLPLLSNCLGQTLDFPLLTSD